MPPRRVKRNLVDVFDENVRPAGESRIMRAPGKKRKCVSMADSIDVDPIERDARWTSRPTAAQQAHVIPLRRQAPEDLVQMNFGAARLGILTILPVHEQDAHYIRPMRRASASSTPLTNFALFSVP